MSFCGSKALLKGHSILDWPLQIQTSPTKTFLSTTVFLPEMLNSSGPPALKLPIRTIHFPFLAVVVAFLPRNRTVTGSPSSAQPQTGTEAFCCNTMLSENRPGSLTSAKVSCPNPIANAHVRTKLHKLTLSRAKAF